MTTDLQVRRLRRVAAALGAILLAGLWWGAGTGTAPRAAAPRPRPAAIWAERAWVTPARYWTRARMAAARTVTSAAGRGDSARTLASGTPWGGDGARRPGLGARWSGGGAVARTTGRVFFTLAGADYTCSGSTVTSTNADVVMTAAHCVSDGGGKWATHWTFVPGYDNGREPYGSYPARRYFVPRQWARGADENNDVAFVAVGTARVSGVEQHVVDAVGGQPVGFGDRAATETAFGYPTRAPYTGQNLDYCDGPLSPDPYGSADAGLACTMTEGDSGGPWLSGFDPRSGVGVITGVTTFRYSDDSLTLYSANLGSVAQTLYDRAQRA